MYQSLRFILAGIARQFVLDKAFQSTHYFREDEISIVGDEVTLSPGKLVKILICYVDEESINED